MGTANYRRVDYGHRLSEAYAVAMARVARVQALMEGWHFRIECHMTHRRTRVLGFPAELRQERRTAIEHMEMAREALRDHQSSARHARRITR